MAKPGKRPANSGKKFTPPKRPYKGKKFSPFDAYKTKPRIGGK